MCIAQFANASSLKKKIRPIASIVWVQGRVEKKRQKGVRKMKKYFCFVLKKYQSVLGQKTTGGGRAERPPQSVYG